MLGAIVGDIIGSRFEWDNIKTKDFALFTHQCHFTDDSVMSLAIAEAILRSNDRDQDLSDKAVECMRKIGLKYPDCGYGGMFIRWLNSERTEPYQSYGNGAAMRVSACGYAAASMGEAIEMARSVTKVTHDHPEGIKGAEAVTASIFLAREGKSILEIRDYIHEHYYPLDFTLDSIRGEYSFDVTCQGSVPQAIMAFIESSDFEDAIRNAISLGGDSDTIAAITGSIAEAYYGIPPEIRKQALTFLDTTLLQILLGFENRYQTKHELSIAYSKRSVRGETKVQTTADDRGQLIASAIDAVDTDLQKSKTEFEETTSQKLYAHLFEACNILRGPINQDEYKSYVTPLLFFKRISDVYDEETVAAQEEYGDDVADFDEDEIHLFSIPDGCHWEDIRNKAEDIGVAIVQAMMGIERANPDTLAGLFSSFDDANWTDKTKLSDERLKDLVEHFSSIKVGNKNYSADVMGDSYEFLIKKFADLSKKNAGEFYTPRTIVELMIKLLKPQAGETVYDPACGTGGMLIEAIRYMHDDKLTYGKIYGQEKNLATSAIARMNLFLHGAGDFKIRQGDTLRSPAFIDRGSLQKFDCVVANPPFSLKNWGADQFANDVYGRNLWGCPTDSNGDFAWLQHMVTSMNPKSGRCAVVLPQGVLFRSGKEGDIRRQLVESDKLEAIITLASGVFYSTGVSACILFLNNQKAPERKGKICMIDASQIFTAHRAQNVMEESDILTVFRLFSDYKDVLEKVKVVEVSDIKEKGYTLAVNNYIEKKEQEIVPPEVVRKQYFEAYNEMLAAEAKMKKLLIEGGYVIEQQN